jgi:hypothetical protein
VLRGITGKQTLKFGEISNQVVDTAAELDHIIDPAPMLGPQF